VRSGILKQQRLLTQFKEHESNIDGVAVTFSSTNRWLPLFLTVVRPCFVDLADLEHARPVLVTKAHPGHSWSAIFSPDNKSLVTSGGDGLIKFWNLETLKVALTWSTAMGRECLSRSPVADIFGQYGR